jgi:hypothetical protein
MQVRTGQALAHIIIIITVVATVIGSTKKR